MPYSLTRMPHSHVNLLAVFEPENDLGRAVGPEVCGSVNKDLCIGQKRPANEEKRLLNTLAYLRYAEVSIKTYA